MELAQLARLALYYVNENITNTPAKVKQLTPAQLILFADELMVMTGEDWPTVRDQVLKMVST